jgi:WD40 repeat protein
LATTEGDKDAPDTIRLWDVETGRPRIDIPRTRPESEDSLTFSPDGKLFVARERDGGLGVCETATGMNVAHIERNASDPGEIHRWDFSPDGRFVLVYFVKGWEGGYIDFSVRFWDVETKKRRVTFHNALAPTFSPDGKRFVCYHLDSGCKIANVDLWQLDEAFPDAVPVRKDIRTDFQTFSPSLDVAATARRLPGSSDVVTVQLWRLDADAEAEPIVQFTAPSYTGDLKFSPAGKFLTWTGRYEMTFWDVKKGFKEVGCVDCRHQFSRDEDWLLTFSDADEPVVYDTATFQPHGPMWRAGDRRPPLGFIGPVTNFNNAVECQLAPDGKTVIVTGLSAGISANPVTALFDRYAAWFKTPGSGEVARLWDVETAQELVAFDGCTHALYSPDGKTLITMYADGTVKVWDVPPRKPVFLLFGFTSVLWLAVLVGVQLWRRLVRWWFSRKARTISEPGA